MSKQHVGSVKVKPKRLSIRRGKSPNAIVTDRSEFISMDGGQAERDSALPPPLRSKLWALFEQIEREFENLYAENMDCKCNVNMKR